MADKDSKPKPHEKANTDVSARSSGTSDAEAVKRNILFGTPIPQPKADTRFKKGQSGNPKGCPKRDAIPQKSEGPTAVASEISQHLKRKMRIKKDGQVSEVSMGVGLIQLMMQQAAGGSILATKTLLGMVLEDGEAEQREIIENENYWLSYKERYATYIAPLIQIGDLSIETWPAPEDVIIVPGKEVFFRGYGDAETYKNAQFLRKLRDATLMKMIYDSVVFYRELYARPQRSYSSNDLLFHLMNLRMPLRWHVSLDEIAERENQAFSTSRKQLRGDLTEAWKAAGFPVPPLALSPIAPMHVLQQLGIASSAMAPREMSRKRYRAKRSSVA